MQISFGKVILNNKTQIVQFVTVEERYPIHNMNS